MQAPPLTRRRFLALAGVTAAGAAIACACSPFSTQPVVTGSSASLRKFRSRPDLTMPQLRVRKRTGAVAPGFIFATIGTPGVTGGPVILDDAGEPVWFLPVTGKSLADFRVQTLNGHPVLTWWEGAVSAGHGQGQAVIADTSYQTIQRVDATGGGQMDLHEFQLTSRGTALVTVYNQVTTSLNPAGVSGSGAVLEGGAQEIDLGTGRSVFEWHSLPAVGLEESRASAPSTGPFDYFHINSIDVDSDENLLISARNTWCVYKVNRTTGAVMWRLGGRKSDFKMGSGTNFEWQHDARRQTGEVITLFDDGAFPKEEPHSRGLVLSVDESARSVALVKAYANDGILSTSQGNFQQLPGGNYFAGWGSQPNLTEFGRDGTVGFDAIFATSNQSYRAYRFPWTGSPVDQPAVAAERGSGRAATLYASWNGATEVARWEVLGGASAGSLSSLSSSPREGFETTIRLANSSAYLAARALDVHGTALATSPPVQV